MNRPLLKTFHNLEFPQNRRMSAVKKLKNKGGKAIPMQGSDGPDSNTGRSGVEGTVLEIPTVIFVEMDATEIPQVEGSSLQPSVMATSFVPVPLLSDDVSENFGSEKFQDIEESGKNGMKIRIRPSLPFRVSSDLGAGMSKYKSFNVKLSSDEVEGVNNLRKKCAAYITSNKKLLTQTCRDWANSSQSKEVITELVMTRIKDPVSRSLSVVEEDETLPWADEVKTSKSSSPTSDSTPGSMWIRVDADQFNESTGDVKFPVRHKDKSIRLSQLFGRKVVATIFFSFDRLYLAKKDGIWSMMFRIGKIHVDSIEDKTTTD